MPDADVAEFEAANNRVVKEITETVAWMKHDLLPQSHGKYALGADAFSKKLLYDEMVDIPLDRLLAIGEANLRRDHEAFTTVAAKIDPHKTPAEVMKAISDDHPAAVDLIPSAERTIEKILTDTPDPAQVARCRLGHGLAQQ